MTSRAPMLDGPGLRVLYIVGTYPTLTTTFIAREIAELRSLGVAVDVISIRSPGSSIQSSPELVAEAERTTYLLPTDLGSLIRAHARILVSRPARYLSVALHLLTRPHPRFTSRLKTLLHLGEAVLAADVSRSATPQHVHAHFLDRASLLANVVARLHGVTYSLTAHANDIYVDPVLVPEKLGGSAFTITVSEFNQRHLQTVAPDVDPSRIEVLHPWVDVAAFDPPERRMRQNALRIVSVGRLVEKKGHEDLIRACRLLREQGVAYSCKIIGDGPLDTELRALVGELDLAGSVELTGPLPQDDVRSALRDSDVFVLACTVAADGDRDGIPVALAEAMAMRLPVISTDIVGIGELVRPGSGWLVPERSPASLAEALAAVQSLDEDERSSVGDEGRRVVARDFDLSTGARRLAQKFQEAVAGRTTVGTGGPA